MVLTFEPKQWTCKMWKSVQLNYRIKSVVLKHYFFTLPYRSPWDVGPILFSSGRTLPKKSFYPIAWLLPILLHLDEKLHSFILHFRFHHSTMQAKSWCRNIWSRQVHMHVWSFSFSFLSPNLFEWLLSSMKSKKVCWKPKVATPF